MSFSSSMSFNMSMSDTSRSSVSGESPPRGGIRWGMLWSSGSPRWNNHTPVSSDHSAQDRESIQRGDFQHTRVAIIARSMDMRDPIVLRNYKYFYTLTHCILTRVPSDIHVFEGYIWVFCNMDTRAPIPDRKAASPPCASMLPYLSLFAELMGVSCPAAASERNDN